MEELLRIWLEDGVLTEEELEEWELGIMTEEELEAYKEEYFGEI